MQPGCNQRPTTANQKNINQQSAISAATTSRQGKPTSTPGNQPKAAFVRSKTTISNPQNSVQRPAASANQRSAFSVQHNQQISAQRLATSANQRPATSANPRPASANQRSVRRPAHYKSASSISTSAQQISVQCQATPDQRSASSNISSKNLQASGRPLATTWPEDSCNRVQESLPRKFQPSIEQ